MRAQVDTGDRSCPHCGSTETIAFPDGSGQCQSCGRAFRGATAPGVDLTAGDVEAGPRSKGAQEKERVGLFGVVGGLLGYLGVPGLFLIGSVLNDQAASDYVATVINTPRAALICGGLSLLIVAATYAIWAGSWVWRGHPEKSVHLILAGLLGTAAGSIAGPGLQGSIGIAGGVLTLVGGLLAYRKTTNDERESTGETSSLPPSA